jgi:hypothetical protein
MLSAVFHPLEGVFEHSRWLSIAALSLLMAGVNAMVLARITAPFSSFQPIDIFIQLQTRDVQLWISINAALVSCYLLVCWRYMGPLARMKQLMLQTSHFLDRPLVIPANAQMMLKEMASLSLLVQEQSRARAALSHELDAVRRVLVQCNRQQETLLDSTSREMQSLYQSILGYAHYLDEHILQKTAESQLRFDFDDVCESGFNLKLIAGALELVRCPANPARIKMSLPGLLQQTMLALAPTLDRRVMRLTTAEVDESVLVHSDPEILSHVVWMVLLGIVRYAAEESTLRMCCRYNSDRALAVLSIVVSELAPGAMSPEERGAHMIRKMQQGSQHMFAETIRIHANIQLAELLLKRLGAVIGVVPLSPYSCEIRLEIPAA